MHNTAKLTARKKSNLRKTHVTRDSCGPATLAISVGLQQCHINAS